MALDHIHFFLSGASNGSNTILEGLSSAGHVHPIPSTTTNCQSKLFRFVWCSGKPQNGEYKSEMSLILTTFLKKILNSLFIFKEKYFVVIKMFTFSRQTFPHPWVFYFPQENFLFG